MSAFPLIEQAILEIAYDNGAINRHMAEERLLSNVMLLLIEQYPEQRLVETEQVLGTLSEDEFVDLMVGARNTCTPVELEEVDELLNFVFDNLG